MEIIRQIGQQAKWFVAKCPNDVAGFIVIAVAVGVLVKLFIIR